MLNITNSADWKDLLRTGLAEDSWQWDWTTLGSVSQPLKIVRGRVVAKADGVWAGAGLLAALPRVAEDMVPDGKFSVKSSLADGARFKTGATICEWSGPAIAVLALERPFLNLAQYLSGIATATRELVDAVTKACPKRTPRVTPTRKTLPHYRDVAIAAVIAGGGFPHRVSLSGGVLIKENHVAAAGGIRKAIEGARETAPHGLKIECEVRDLEELAQALVAHADGVLLDNFSPAQVKAALAEVDAASKKRPRPFVEVSGGLNIDTIAKYALPGVDILSVGSMTHSVRALDLSFLVG